MPDPSSKPRMENFAKEMMACGLKQRDGDSDRSQALWEGTWSSCEMTSHDATAMERGESWGRLPRRGAGGGTPLPKAD